MKKIFLVSILVILGHFACAQKIHFADNSNSWTFFDYSCGGDLYFVDSQIARFVDTITIHDTLYLKLWSRYEPAAYIREDTVLHKVFAIQDPTWVDRDTIRSEQLLYDYTLNIGDTFRASHTVHHVASIDSVIVGGYSHKVWHLKSDYIDASLHMATGDYDVIEGIGSVVSPTDPLHCYFFEGCTTLTCFSTHNITPPLSHLVGPYFDNSASCNLTFGLGINNIGSKVETTDMYPNPTIAELTITSTQRITQVTIANLLGQVIYTKEYNAEKVQVEVADLPAGVYLLKINNSEIRRFVKD